MECSNCQELKDKYEKLLLAWNDMQRRISHNSRVALLREKKLSPQNAGTFSILIDGAPTPEETTE